MQSICDQWKRRPTKTPRNAMEKMMQRVEMMGEMPILRIFLNEKSSPKENSRNMTPMSAHM